jgi:hypothetical protein
VTAALRLRLSIVAAAVACGCVSWTSRSAVTVTSHPSGARILVDGVDTGLTTPAQIAPSASSTITVAKEGYGNGVRALGRRTTTRVPRWLDGAVSDPSIALPLFWVTGDLFFPIQISHGVDAQHVYFHLEPAPLR